MGVSRMSLQCFKSVLRKIEGCFVNASIILKVKFQMRLKSISKILPRCLKNLFVVSHERFKGVSLLFQGSFFGIS